MKENELKNKFFFEWVNPSKDSSLLGLSNTKIFAISTDINPEDEENITLSKEDDEVREGQLISLGLIFFKINYINYF